MATFQLPERQLMANVKSVSPSIQVAPSAFTRTATMQITSSEWVAKAGTGTIDFGVEVSPDGGTNWESVSSVTGVTIGWLGKGTIMPNFSCSSPQLVGKTARIFMRATVNIKVGIAGEIV